VLGVYGGFLDKIPFSAVMNRSITIKTGQTPVHRYLQPLLERVQKGDFDPSFVISHNLEVAPRAYEMFRDKEDHCTKVVLKP
jgi:threonine dehydrogenase-like Zn-dependent dehydrogenase